jgi:hypothetical protein
MWNRGWGVVAVDAVVVVAVVCLYCAILWSVVILGSHPSQWVSYFFSLFPIGLFFLFLFLILLFYFFFSTVMNPKGWRLLKRVWKPKRNQKGWNGNKTSFEVLWKYPCIPCTCILSTCAAAKTNEAKGVQEIEIN